MNTKILCVDDDINILAGFRRSLRGKFALDVASSGQDGLKMVADEGPYAVIVADMNMPQIDGIQFLIKAKAISPESVRIMLTGNADQQTAMAAVNQGAVFQFLTKPCRPDMLTRTLEVGIRQYQLIVAERELLENTLNGSIKVLMDVLSMTSPAVFGEGERLREDVRKVAASMGCQDIWELEMAAMLARVGLVTVPQETIQRMQAGLTISGAEADMFRRVPELGADLIRNIPRLENVADMVLYQEKNFDGSGFPTDRDAGEEIPFGGRLLNATGAFRRLQSNRIGPAEAIESMREQAAFYDPTIVAALESCFVSPDSGGRIATTRELIIPAADVRVGDVFIEDVATEEGVVIVGAGARVNPMVAEKLSNFAQLGGIQEPFRVERSEL